ncbi:MAG TPA: right-handed parallel beta-helix repeat-containing protein [Lysobacter sp.]
MTLRAFVTCVLLAGTAPAHAETFYACDMVIDALPATITTQGVYCLTQDVSTAIASGNAITINANNVTLDCNGYKIGGLGAGTGTNAYGVHATDRTNVTVRQCSIRGFRYAVVFDGTGASGGVIEDNRLSENRDTAVFVNGNGHTIRRNLVSQTGGRPASAATGIRLGGHLHDVSDNNIHHVFASGASGLEGMAVGIGLNSSNGTVVRGNRVQAVYRGGTGSAIGIDAFGQQLSVEGNSLALLNVGAEAAGYGIWGSTKTACRDNLVSGWTTPLQSCTVLLDNVVDPPPP